MGKADTMEGQADNGAPEDEVGRRSVIKKIGAGAALAWSAPAIVGISKASAQTASDEANRCETCENGNTACEDIFLCGPGNDCNCWVRADGQGNCCGVLFNFCSEANTCDANNECPPGYTCIATCCSENLCVPHCASGLPLKSAGVGAKSGPRPYLVA